MVLLLQIVLYSSDDLFLQCSVSGTFRLFRNLGFKVLDGPYGSFYEILSTVVSNCLLSLILRC